MLTIPSAAEQLFLQFSITFTQPTFQRILPLAIGAILTTGRRTVTAVLWTIRIVIKGHHSTYHRVFSRAVWSLWPLGEALATAILRYIPPDQPVLVPIDDTTAQYAVVFLRVIFCPKAVPAVKLLAVESQLAACKHQIDAEKCPRL